MERTTSNDWVRQPFTDVQDYTYIRHCFETSRLPTTSLDNKTSQGEDGDSVGRTNLDKEVPIPTVTPLSRTNSSELHQDILNFSLQEVFNDITTDIPKVPGSVPLDLGGLQPNPRKAAEINETKVCVVRRKFDVLLGRGGLTNNNPGNKRYLDEVASFQPWYKKCTDKQEKTKTAEGIVAFVQDYGGRFLQKDATSGKWFVVPDKVARRKVSQALREHTTVKKRADTKQRSKKT